MMPFRPITFAALACLAAAAPAALAAQDSAASSAADVSTSDPSAGITLAALRALGLNERPGEIAVHHTPGYGARAAALQSMLEEAADFFADSLGVRAPVSLALLDEAHWTAMTPIPYTFPFYAPSPGIIFLGATPEGIVSAGLRAGAEHLPAERLARIRDAGFTVEAASTAAVDLIGLHELGHLYVHAYGIQPPGHWLNEFLATYFGYAFLRRARPELAEMWLGIIPPPPGQRQPHASLEDFDRMYFGVGPENYAWYQGMFAARVGEVFAAQGLGFLEGVRDAFPVGAADPVAAGEVMARLERLHPGFAAWAAEMAAMAGESNGGAHGP
jgi:hypothetical protein